MQTIGQRYVIQDKLGQGGMGVVYRAYDRLAGQTIALKQVFWANAVDSEATAPVGMGIMVDSDESRHALANEFRTLAGLRHPHIVSVLDYGFDEHRHPFYTMTLVEEAKDLLEITRGMSLEKKMQCAMQVLQALIYLHRCKVIHCDLKPSNILVANSTVKLLDFGLAVMRGDNTTYSTTTLGTLKYMAPELLSGNSPTEASDLWAFGIILYEILVERSPYPENGFMLLFNAVRNQIIDISDLSLPAPILSVLDKLLQRDMVRRYQSAHEVLRGLQSALQLEIPANTLIRESFLQAAPFVGRETELQSLQSALSAALVGRGSMWLIGGESGVGKSRLVNELRTNALVNGIIVARGQGHANHGFSYQLWRDVLPRLILEVELTDIEAGILQEIVPNIAELLGRTIPPAPVVRGKVAQERLTHTIQSVLERQTQPLLLILEDLQWVQECLVPLQRLQASIEQMPLLIIGTYRHNERPTLADDLPNAKTLMVARLTERAVAELSKSMLGEWGLKPEILELMNRETEGNTFFMVEVARVLAELTEQGIPNNASLAPLPDTIFTEGMHQILQRRLAHIAPEYRPILELAAVIGRKVDLRLLKYLAPATAFDDWLAQAQLAAIFEIQDNEWQFTHDKLREAVLYSVEYAPHLHQQVAEAIEALYDAHLYAEVLMEHWRIAQNLERESYYLLIVADNMVNNSAQYAGAQQLLQRAVTLTTPTSQHFLLLGICDENTAQYAQAIQHYEQSLALAEQTHDSHTQVDVLLRIAFVLFMSGRYDDGKRYTDQALALAKAKRYQNGVADALLILGQLSSNITINSQEAERNYQEALAIYRDLQKSHGIAQTLRNLGILANGQGHYAVATQYFTESLAIDAQVGTQFSIAASLNNLGLATLYSKQFATAIEHLQAALKIRKTIGDQRGIAATMQNLGISYYYQHKPHLAQHHHAEALAIRQKVQHTWGIAESFYHLAKVAQQQHDFEQATSHYQQALELYQSLNNQPGILHTHLQQTTLHFQTNQPINPSQLAQNLTRVQEINTPHIQLIALAQWAGWQWQQGQHVAAQTNLRYIVGHPNYDIIAQDQIEIILTALGAILPNTPQSLTPVSLNNLIILACQELEKI